MTHDTSAQPSFFASRKSRIELISLTLLSRKIAILYVVIVVL